MTTQSWLRSAIDKAYFSDSSQITEAYGNNYETVSQIKYIDFVHNPMSNPQSGMATVDPRLSENIWTESYPDV